MWCFVSFFGSEGEIVFGVKYRTYLVYNIVVRLCQFFGCGGKELSCDLSKILIGFLYLTEST